METHPCLKKEHRTTLSKNFHEFIGKMSYDIVTSVCSLVGALSLIPVAVAVELKSEEKREKEIKKHRIINAVKILLTWVHLLE